MIVDKDLMLLKKLYSKSFNLYKEGKYKESLSLILNTSELWIDYIQKSRFLFLLGINYFKLEENDRAERALLESLAIIPDDIRVLDLLGKIYFLQERFVESEKIFLRAKKNDFYNFHFSIKTAKSAWMSGNFKRMFKRLKEGYIPQLIGEKEEKKLKELLLDFLRNSNIDHAFFLIKQFRKWCYEKRLRMRKNLKK